MLSNKPKIVQQIAGFNQTGGPSSQLRRILRSRMADKYDFAIVTQDRPAKGINLRLILEMAQSIKKNKPDLVHVRGLQNEGFHGVMAAYLAGCRRILVSVHGFSEDSTVRKPINRWVLTHVLEPLTLILAQRVYCVCEAGVNKPVIRKFASQKSSVIYNGIEITPLKERDTLLRKQLGAENEDVIALYVGRISRDKGLLVLAEAVSKMANPPIIWLAGDGPDSGDVRAAFGARIESGHVRLLGRREDIPALLNACDFFVFPTLFENLSNSLLEAMHSARAVIATTAGGNPEVVMDGVTGALIPANDPAALTQKIKQFSDNRELCRTMGQKGRERILQCFSLDQTIEGLTNLYDSMLKI